MIKTFTRIFLFSAINVTVLLCSRNAVSAETTNGGALLDSQVMLTLQMASELAIQNNKEIQVRLATLPIAQTALIVAKYRPNPIVSSQNELVTGGSLHPIQIALPIELGRKRFYRQEVAKQEIAKTELEINKLIWETHIKVHPSYASAVILADLLILAKARTDFYQKLYSNTQARYEAGDAAKLDLNRAYLEVLASNNYVNEVEAKLSQAKINLNSLLGLEPRQELFLNIKEEELISIDTISAKIEVQEYLEAALVKRIEVMILESDYGIKHAQLKQAQWDKVPNLQIETAIVHPSIGDDGWGPYFGIQSELPIFNRKQGEIKKVEAEIEYLDREKDRLDLSIKSEIENALFNFKTREKQLRRFQQNVLGESLNILESIQFGYQQGQLSLTDVLNAGQKNREIKENYLQSILNYQVAFADLEYALGVELDDLMQRN